MIGIIGATGNIGTAVLDELDRRDIGATLIVRDPQRLAGRNTGAHTIRAGDLRDPASLRSGLEGCTSLICITADSVEQSDLERNAYQAAAAAGASKIVKLSAQSAALQPPASFGRVHQPAEKAALDTGLATLMVRPVFFAQTLMSMADSIKGGKLIYPSGKGRIAFVDIRDVADVLVTGALDESRVGTATLTGPEAFTMGEIAQQLAGVTGHKVRHISPPAFIAKRALPKLAGVSKWTAEMIVELASAQKSGAQATVTEDVAQITGHQARSVGAFLSEHARMFS
jgi:uncharacterized protein YbjT (DUF2867 family)